jgi:competence ComEA-like helix-hairpin-helix protein
MKRVVTTLRETLSVTALEARAVLLVALVFSVGTAATFLETESDLHAHATATRIDEMLDSLERREDATSGPVSTDQQNVEITQTSPQEARAPTHPRRPINLNTATAAELDALPGVGPATAQAIVASRARSRFTSTDDLLDIRGIGEKKLERIRPYVTAP